MTDHTTHPTQGMPATTLSRRAMLRQAGLAAGTTFAAAALMSSPVAAATLPGRPYQTTAHRGARSGAAKANVVLVHGAWADGSSWSRVIQLLEDAGYGVTAAQIPLTALADDVAVTRRVLAMQNGPTVLVGHSVGGAVISAAGTDAPNVVSLVYVAAFAPDEGETLEGLTKRFPPVPGLAQLRPDKGGFLWLDRAGFGEAFAQDVDPRQARIMAAVQKPIAAAYLGARAPRPAWHALPSWFLVSANDRMIPPEAERWMARRMGAAVRVVPSSHAAPVSHPVDVVALIKQAAHIRART